jgi:hypothetical protein
MAVKKIGGEADKPKQDKKFAEDVAMKPLVRQYMKQNADILGKPFPVIAGRLTTNGWFLIETNEFVLLLPGASKVCTELFVSIFPGLSGKQKKQLVVVPDRTDKYGGYLAIDDEKRTEYHWNDEDYVLTVGKQPEAKKMQKGLSLADFD